MFISVFHIFATGNTSKQTIWRNVQERVGGRKRKIREQNERNQIPRRVLWGLRSGWPTVPMASQVAPGRLSPDCPVLSPWAAQHQAALQETRLAYQPG